MNDPELLRYKATILEMLALGQPESPALTAVPWTPEVEDDDSDEFDLNPRDDLDDDGLAPDEVGLRVEVGDEVLPDHDLDEPDGAGEPPRAPRRVRFRIHPPPDEGA